MWLSRRGRMRRRWKGRVNVHKAVCLRPATDPVGVGETVMVPAEGPGERPCARQFETGGGVSIPRPRISEHPQATVRAYVWIQSEALYKSPDRYRNAT